MPLEQIPSPFAPNMRWGRCSPSGFGQKGKPFSSLPNPNRLRVDKVSMTTASIIRKTFTYNEKCTRQDDNRGNYTRVGSESVTYALLKMLEDNASSDHIGNYLKFVFNWERILKGGSLPSFATDGVNEHAKNCGRWECYSWECCSQLDVCAEDEEGDL